jgi:hypothetical protein
LLHIYDVNIYTPVNIFKSDIKTEKIDAGRNASMIWNIQEHPVIVNNFRNMTISFLLSRVEFSDVTCGKLWICRIAAANMKVFVNKMKQIGHNSVTMAAVLRIRKQYSPP